MSEEPSEDVAVTDPHDSTRDFYDDVFMKCLLARGDGRDLNATVSFLMTALDLHAGSRVLEQGCGVGRLALPLAAEGCVVTGVDLVPSYVDHARRLARERKLEKASFEVGDAATWVAPAQVDAVFSWYTSFGIFPDRESNVDVLRSALSSLRPGGRLAIEYRNLAYLLAERQSWFAEEFTDGEGRLWMVVHHNTFDVSTGRAITRRTYTVANQEWHRRELVLPMYMPHDLWEMASEAGFVDIEMFGGTDWSHLTERSPRCVLTARRPG